MAATVWFEYAHLAILPK